MRINKIDNNVNFQMALKIDKAARGKLSELPVEQIEELGKFAETIKDLNLFNVHLNENLEYSIRSNVPGGKKNFLEEFRFEESRLGKHYSRTEYDGGGEVEIGGFYPDIPWEFRTRYGSKAGEEYGVFKKLGTRDQIGKLSRILEELELERIAKEDAAAAAKRAAEEAARVAREQKDAAINKLLDQYGYDVPKPAEVPPNEKITIKKRNFFQRLFGK